MSAIVFDRVHLAHGARDVLRGVSLSIAAGEFVGLLGPNGAGKTTFLRAILGLVRPVAGTVELLGRPARRGSRCVGYLPQYRSHGNAGALTGYDVVSSVAGGWRWGLPVPNAAERKSVEAALEAVGATELAYRPLGELSGGERQRLLLAQTLLGSPKILALDEPLAGLDPAHQAGVVTLVKRLQREHGLTVLFSAHDLNPLIGFVDRVLYLGGGSAVIGTVDEVVTGPVLSRLYHTPIDVVRLGNRRFVTQGAVGDGIDDATDGSTAGDAGQPSPRAADGQSPAAAPVLQGARPQGARDARL